MKRLISTALLIMALYAQTSGQGGKQLSAQEFVSVTDVQSIPLADNLAEKERSAAKRLEKSGRELNAPQSASPAAEDKKRFWVVAEYLNWRTKGSYLPPLAQRLGPTFGPGDEVLVGDREVNPGNSGGGRITAGFWLNRNRTVGLEASYFYLGPRSVNQSFSSLGESFSIPIQPVIRPFTSAILANPLFVISGNVGARGSLTPSMASHLQGAEVNSVYDQSSRFCCGLRLIAGFRFLDLKERLTVLDNHVFNSVDPLGDIDDRFYLVTDEFSTRNRFYGGQGGVETKFSRGRLSVELSGKVALGSVRQLVNISGSTALTSNVFRTPRVFLGGFLALESNIGRYERSRFALLPEAKASVGYRLTDNLTAFAGYDFLYINRVARPAEQIDLTINWGFVPFIIIEQGPLPPFRVERPAFSFSDSPFWAQGLTVGLRFGF